MGQHGRVGGYSAKWKCTVAPVSGRNAGRRQRVNYVKRLSSFLDRFAKNVYRQEQWDMKTKRLPWLVRCKKMCEMEDHAMSLVPNGYALSTRREFLGALFSAFLGLALFDPGLATAQQGKEIKLTEKHIQSFMAAYNDMVKVYESADPDKPDDPKLEAQVEAIAKRNGFANLAEFDDVHASISTVMSGIDPQTKKFTEPPEQIKKEIAALKSDKTVPDAEKKDDLAELEAALKIAKPIQFKENIALVLKYFDKLSPLMMQEPGRD